MHFTVCVLSKTESVDGDEVTIGMPDENGQIITLKGCAEGDLNALVPGVQYTLAFVPCVVATAPEAVKTEGPEDAIVPVDHPVVIDEGDAYMSEPANPPAPPAEVPPEAPVEATTEVAVEPAAPEALVDAEPIPATEPVLETPPDPPADVTVE